MKSRTGKGLSIVVALAFMIPTSFFLNVTPNISAVSNSTDYSYTSSITFTSYDRILTDENRIIDNGWYNGPLDSMVQAVNGDYLAFIREGTSHVGDNGSLKLYRSVNNAIDFSMNATLRNITHRDVRNYASGITDTGRIFVFYSIYDPLNNTWPTPIEYQYSDNNGTTWAGPITMSLPTVDGFVPNDGSPFGNLRILATGRIGFSAYLGNGTYVQVRFIYSDDNGATWHHIAMGSPTGPSPNFRTETEIVYLGNGRLVALAREDNTAGPDMFTSTDNGLTWTFHGYLPFGLPGSTMTSLSIISDSVGIAWALAIFSQHDSDSWWYSIAYGDDLMSSGIAAWEVPIITTDLSGGYPVTIFHADTGIGFIMTETNETDAIEFVSIWNLTASITRATYPTSISSLVSVTFTMFAIGIIVGVIAEGTNSLRKMEMRTTEKMVKSLLNMVIYIVIGMASLGIMYSMV